jgi:hypothetical protein
MINREVRTATYAEVNSQVAQYFGIFDQFPQIADTNKRYTLTQNPCYSSSCPIQRDSGTTVVISPTSDNIADIYNGFIYAEMEVNLNLSAAVTSGEFGKTWVGFKDAMNAIEKYEILANGISIYSQSNAIEESYITDIACTDTIKKSDIYSKVRHKEIWNKKFKDQCGTWITWGADVATTKIIKLKIDLRRFLPLSNLKYLPAFAGKIELKLHFSTKGLVCAVANPVVHIDKAWQPWNYKSIPYVSNEFSQLGDDFLMISAHTSPSASSEGVITQGTLTAGIRYIQPGYYQMRICETNIHNFGLIEPIYTQLVQKYSQQVLTIPTQTLIISSMSGKLKNKGGISKVTTNITPRFIDTIFLLFPLRSNHRTVYKNPGFRSWQLSCGGYGQIPASAYGTIEEPRFVELCTNAVNLNSDTFGLNTEVLNSLIDENTTDARTGNTSTDRTSFFIGIPTETDNTFQQGQTSNTPITYELTVSEDNDSSYAEDVDSPPIIGLLIDTTFNIMINNNGQPPIVSLSSYDITSPTTL